MEARKQSLDSIYSQIALGTELIDIRPQSAGIVFGRVRDVCRQYGIKHKKLDRCIEFSAPRQRLQVFIEKLHFSRHSYAYKPY